MIYKEIIVNDLKKVASIVNKIPSIPDYEKYGSYNKSTVYRKFGSWNNALLFTFNKTNNIKSPKKQLINCENCKKLTKNNKFCSHSCSAIAINAKNKINYIPKLKAKRKCHCGSFISNKTRNDKCRKCYDKFKVEQFGEQKISSFSSKYARHKYQNIREHAHRVAKLNNMIKKCSICEYNLHVELCHKKSINSFSTETTLNIVNHVSNLIYLCPNHHWELDNFILSIA